MALKPPVFFLMVAGFSPNVDFIAGKDRCLKMCHKGCSNDLHDPASTCVLFAEAAAPWGNLQQDVFKFMWCRTKYEISVAATQSDEGFFQTIKYPATGLDSGEFAEVDYRDWIAPSCNMTAAPKCGAVKIVQNTNLGFEQWLALYQEECRNLTSTQACMNDCFRECDAWCECGWGTSAVEAFRNGTIQRYRREAAGASSGCYSAYAFMKVCVCSHGVAAEHDGCLFHGMEQCVECVSGYTLTAERNEVKCQANICVCDHGTPATGAECLVHGATKCSRDGCNALFHFEDDDCKANVCICNHGTPVSSAKCFVHGAMKCRSDGCDANLLFRKDKCQIDCEDSYLGDTCAACSGHANMECTASGIDGMCNNWNGEWSCLVRCADSKLGDVCALCVGHANISCLASGQRGTCSSRKHGSKCLVACDNSNLGDACATCTGHANFGCVASGQRGTCSHQNHEWKCLVACENSSLGDACATCTRHANIGCVASGQRGTCSNHSNEWKCLVVCGSVDLDSVCAACVGHVNINCVASGRQGHCREINGEWKCSAVGLVGGHSPSWGNVYVDGWPVCDDAYWNDDAASVVCRMLGYSSGKHFMGSSFGYVGDIFSMDDVKCRGHETSIKDCEYSSKDDCFEHEGAGVQCFTASCASARHSCTSPQVLDETKMNHACVSLLCTDAECCAVTCKRSDIGSVCAACVGHANMNCVANGRRGHCREINEEWKCSDVGLVGGHSPSWGNVYVDGLPICKDVHWTDDAARVVCRMLGYATGKHFMGFSFGYVRDIFPMDDVKCRGNETSIKDCEYSSKDDCFENKGVGVECFTTSCASVKHPCTSSWVLDEAKMNHACASGLCTNAECCAAGCEHSSLGDACAICTGHANVGCVASGQRGTCSYHSEAWKCLVACENSSLGDACATCTGHANIGCVANGQPGTCSNYSDEWKCLVVCGSVDLDSVCAACVGHVNINCIASGRQGHCREINGEWKCSAVGLVGGHSPSWGNVYVVGLPVCDDHYWNDDAARVVCRMLGYATGKHFMESTFGYVGDIFSMDDVKCRGNETSIKDCEYNSKDDCFEDEGAGVQCFKTSCASAKHSCTSSWVRDDAKMNHACVSGLCTNADCCIAGCEHSNLGDACAACTGHANIGCVANGQRGTCSHQSEAWKCLVACENSGLGDACATCAGYVNIGCVASGQRGTCSNHSNEWKCLVVCESVDLGSVCAACAGHVNVNCVASGRRGHCREISGEWKCSAVGLVGGYTPSRGNVYVDGLPICDDANWNDDAARVVCRMLGYATGRHFTGSSFGNVGHFFSMDDINCRGNETSIKDCEYSSKDCCFEDEGAGVQCFTTSCASAKHSCTSPWVLDEAKMNHACASGLCTNAECCIAGCEHSNLGDACAACTGHANIGCVASGQRGTCSYHSEAWKCLVGCENSSLGDTCEICTGHANIGCVTNGQPGTCSNHGDEWKCVVVCESVDLDSVCAACVGHVNINCIASGRQGHCREIIGEWKCSAVGLVGGHSPLWGNVYVDGLPICDDANWNDDAARVVCRMLGYASGKHFTGSSFGNVGHFFSMDDINCRGNETSIKDCEYNSKHDCAPQQGAGVQCFRRK